jgi:hypothetical protein
MNKQDIYQNVQQPWTYAIQLYELSIRSAYDTFE